MRLKRAFPYFQPVVVDRLCGVLQYFCNVHTLVHTKSDKRIDTLFRREAVSVL